MRPRWFPPLRHETPEADAQVILQCQGMWWLWGGSICRKPEPCIAAMRCYFVQQAAKIKHPGAIRWSFGFDPEPAQPGLWAA